jgi:hypothetical protein
MAIPLALAGGIVGGGLGLLGGLFGDDEQTTTSTRTIDPETERFIQDLRNRGLTFADRQARTPAGVQQVRGISGDLANILPGLLNERGLSGIEGFFNPEVEGHIAATQADFDRQRGLTSRRAADIATREGAFGGSRSAVLEAEGLRNVGEIEASTVSGLRSDAYNRAAERLLSERGFRANLGFQGLQGLMGVEQFMDARQLAALQQLGTLTGPTSETTTGTQPIHRDPISGLIGGAFTGASIASGIPPSTASRAGNTGTGGLDLGYNPYNFNLTGRERGSRFDALPE